MDTLSKERRSELMSRIGSQNTSPEMLVRKLVFGLGRRYRLHDKTLPGSPDLVLARDQKVIFVHGCFWHQHSNCRRARMPKSRLNYWLPKLKRNLARDRESVRMLRKQGWQVLTVRECQLANLAVVERRIDRFLSGKRASRDATRSRRAERRH